MNPLFSKRERKEKKRNKNSTTPSCFSSYYALIFSLSTGCWLKINLNLWLSFFFCRLQFVLYRRLFVVHSKRVFLVFWHIARGKIWLYMLFSFASPIGYQKWFYVFNSFQSDKAIVFFPKNELGVYPSLLIKFCTICNRFCLWHTQREIEIEIQRGNND